MLPSTCFNTGFEDLSYFKPDCKKCFGLCCVALYFSTHDGFPTDKQAGVPCLHLDETFRCCKHSKLIDLGLKGCVAYDCLGAGQQVSQVTFGRKSWHNDPLCASLMFQAYPIMRELHELLWYLFQARAFPLPPSMLEDVETALYESIDITKESPSQLIAFHLPEHHAKISGLLQTVSRQVRGEMNNGKKASQGKPKKDLFGKDLRQTNLKCADLRGACLIAANLEGVDLTGTDFIGADLRDTRLGGADLSRSIFLTQFQINSANGNSYTKLPSTLFRPDHWA